MKIRTICSVMLCLTVAASIGAAQSRADDNDAAKSEKPRYFIEDKKLSDGHTIPVVGLGTSTLSDDDAANAVYAALKVGMRLVDTARVYNNEVGVGRGVRRAIDDGIVKREDVFVTTKIWDQDYSHAGTAFEESLSKLGLDYVDLVLLHNVPRPDDEKAYHELEEKVKEGKIKSLGLSNIYLDNDTFERIYNAAEIKPVLVQNENHPFYQNTEFQEYLGKFGAYVESWSPLGGRGSTQQYFNNETLKAIASAHNKSVPQILLRWQIQAGYIAIPGASNPDYIKEDYELFDFELTEEEMQKIKEMNTGNRNSFFPGGGSGFGGGRNFSNNRNFGGNRNFEGNHNNGWNRGVGRDRNFEGNRNNGGNRNSEGNRNFGGDRNFGRPQQR